MRSMQWQLGILRTISAFAFRHRETKKTLCRGGRLQDLPNTDFQPAVRHLNKTRLPAFRTGRLYLQEMLLILISDRKNFMSMKNPLIPAGIEPATFRCVAQHLNPCATAVPPYTVRNVHKFFFFNLRQPALLDYK